MSTFQENFEYAINEYARDNFIPSDAIQDLVRDYWHHHHNNRNAEFYKDINNLAGFLTHIDESE